MVAAKLLLEGHGTTELVRTSLARIERANAKDPVRREGGPGGASAMPESAAPSVDVRGTLRPGVSRTGLG